MYSLVLVLNMLSGLGVIGLVLMQHGKGADMGAAFGGGSSGSLFGATGSSNFLSKSTAVLAAIFLITCLSLNYMAGKQPHATSVVDGIVVDPAKSDVPAPSAPAADPRTSDIPK
ncbi:MAG TPA: preprotein translocase subunit SecG [Rhodocyclaceae bacterium]|jgi:preprotein translocase subunit SecG|nr:preprotein translocase subunit SecG [Rhodocyclaceae bacterium]